MNSGTFRSDSELELLDHFSRRGDSAPPCQHGHAYPESRTFAELLIDCEDDRTLRAVLVGMLQQAKTSPGARVVSG